ncbi:hypothetical protein PSPO01_00149 [Paraphaeosphaeria sporulosa]
MAGRVLHVAASPRQQIFMPRAAMPVGAWCGDGSTQMRKHDSFIGKKEHVRTLCERKLRLRKVFAAHQFSAVPEDAMRAVRATQPRGTPQCHFGIAPWSQSLQRAKIIFALDEAGASERRAAMLCPHSAMDASPTDIKISSKPP